MTQKEFNTILKEKMDALKEDQSLAATNYCNEMWDLILCTTKDMVLFDKKEELEKKLQEADSYSISSEGDFHKLALISIFPKTFYGVYIDPFEDV